MEEDLGLDAYWLFLRDRREVVVVATDLVEDKRHTFGTRLFGLVAEVLDWSEEFAFQLGETGAAESSIQALALELLASLVFEEIFCTPDFTAGYAFATGDSSGGGGKAETFRPLFQDNHPRYGLSDAIVLSNIHVVSTKASFNPLATLDHDFLRTGAGLYFYWAARNEDATNLGVAGTTGGSHYAGTELNLFVDLPIHERIKGQLAWAILFPGDRVDRHFTDDDNAHRLYAHIEMGF